MTEQPFRFAKTTGLAFALLLTAGALSGATAGPFSSPGGFAVPGTPNSNLAQLKQISGFTGNMAFSHSDGGYQPLGGSFNKFIKLRFSVTCPANYRVHEAGIRARGNDVHNYEFELVSPGDLPFDQNTWEQAIEQEPWDFDAVVSVGATALEAAGNNGPVYVSLNEKLDSRTEFYGSCSPSQPSSGLPFLYYDSTDDNGHMRPMTRVRYQVQHNIAATPGHRLKAAAPPSGTPRSRISERLRHRDRAATGGTPVAPLAPVLKAPGGCPYDCPPPAGRTRLAN